MSNKELEWEYGVGWIARSYKQKKQEGRCSLKCSGGCGSCCSDRCSLDVGHKGKHHCGRLF